MERLPGFRNVRRKEMRIGTNGVQPSTQRPKSTPYRRGQRPGCACAEWPHWKPYEPPFSTPPLSLRNLVLARDHHRNPHGAHSAYAEGAPKTLPTRIPRMFTPPHQPILLETNRKSPPSGLEGVARRRASRRLGEENGVVRHPNKTPARYKGWNINNALCKPACKQN